ncbi:MAG: peptidoglycan DD-metalloendopeptidase family protein [Patescibacteria group bacterium]
MLKNRLLPFLIVFLFLAFAVPGFFSYAQTARDLQNKIEDKNAEIDKLEQEIKQYQGQLDTLGKQKSSLAGALELLDITKKKLNADISVTQNKIDKTNLKIEGLSKDIGTKESSIGTATDAISLEIKKTDELEQESLIENILAEDDFTLVWTDINNMATVREKIRENILTLRQVKGQLEDTRQETIDAKNELISLRAKLADQKKIIDQNVSEKNKLLAETKNSEASYQKLLSDELVKKTALEKEVSDYESQLKYILDPKSLPKGGVLSWPLDSILITNLFGKNTSGIYASGLHNGVDFRAAIGTPVKAMADGVVAGTGDTDLQCPRASFGRFVLIKYNNGLASTFGHLSLIKTYKGAEVKRGDIVGYSGNTGYSTAAHLHVSVYARDAVDVQSLPSKSCPGRILTQPISPTNAYLDPLFYLPKATSDMYKSTLVRPD